ncbi:MAG: hypothetical protein IJE59_02930 [Clostridia bacterium]|nr:hypothetical protein [Clostridia bacterium]
MMGKYNDIINLSRPISKRPKMTLEQRSAQFAPFAALTGYDEKIKETSRLTNERIEIDDELKSALDIKLQLIREEISNKPKITINYFVPDLKKNGGNYKIVTDNVKRIDEYKKMIILENEIEIPISEIIDITGEMFKLD